MIFQTKTKKNIQETRFFLDLKDVVTKKNKHFVKKQIYSHYCFKMTKWTHRQNMFKGKQANNQAWLTIAVHNVMDLSQNGLRSKNLDKFAK